jgi:acyl-CoA synthetase (AMP-forming)/AMP-acid ligase II
MHMMSPIDFVKNPLLWLDLMSRHRVHWGVAPDFAFHLVARKFIEARDKNRGKCPIPGLDLSCLHNLQNGTEPIKPSTAGIFNELFASYGLRKNWFHAGYGLAENVVGVCWIHGYHTSSPRDEDVAPIVAVGSKRNFHPSLVVKIVDTSNSEEVNDGVTGELWIAGPSVAAGYYRKPELTEQLFQAKMKAARSMETKRFLRTGDLAFFQNDKLYICGRIKDLVIINGVNYYPQDIEHAVQEASPAVRPGCVAAFSSSDTSDGAGGLEIVFEIRNQSSNNAADVIQKVRRSVIEIVGLVPFRIVAIKERSIPKTTSGKIKRRASRLSLHAE